MLDNADGKQARKIGASSPLGMLFDHGCDSLITGFFIISWLKFIRTGLSFGGFSILLFAMNGFYFATLETYYMGGLFLPVINVPSDGNMILVLAALPGVIAKSNVWFDWIVPFTNFLTWRQFWVTLCPTCAILLSVQNIYKLMKLTSIKDLLSKMLTVILINSTFILIFLFPGETDNLKW